MFNVVLIEPEIPQNTGNIVRTIAATGCKLHLIEPLGFDISDKALKRAGLDYWGEADITVYPNLAAFFEKNSGNFYFSTTKGQLRYSDVSYKDGDYLFFGKETKGIDEQLLSDNYDRCIRIPMMRDTRSLNLSNSVAIVLYEALRQTDFAGFNTVGHLHRLPTPDLK